jgi:hypothetical protein
MVSQLWCPPIPNVLSGGHLAIFSIYPDGSYFVGIILLLVYAGAVLVFCSVVCLSV